MDSGRTSCCEDILTKLEDTQEKLLNILNPSTPAALLLTEQDGVSTIKELECCISSLRGLTPPPSPIVHLDVVRKVFKICEREELSNSCVFQSLGLQLGSLFKAAYSLLKGCLDNIENKQWTSHSELKTLIVKEVDIASLSLNFDPSLVVFCWRSIGKLLCSNTQICHSLIRLGVEQLSVALTTTIHQSTLQTDLLLEKRVKSLKFLTSLLFRLTNQFPDEIAKCADIMVDLLLSSHQIVYALRDRGGLVTSLEPILLLLRDPLVECMSSHSAFLCLILEPNSVSLGQHYGWGLCLMSLCRCYPSLPEGLQSHCLETTSSRAEALSSSRLMDVIFHCIENCHQEVSTPYLVPHSGEKDPSDLVSFIELVSCHVCLLLSSLTTSQLSHMERNLLAHIFIGHFYSALLASDLLAFIARLGGPSVIEDYYQFLSSLLQSLPPSPAHSFPVHVLASLVSRLLRMLSRSTQFRLLSNLSRDEDWLWSYITPSALHEDTLKSVAPQLVTTAISSLNTSTPGNQGCSASLHCLCVMYASPNPSTLQSSTVVLKYLISLLNHCHVTSCHVLCLRLISYLLPSLSSPEITQVFSLLSKLTANPSLSCSLALCGVLASCSSLHFDPSIEEGVLKGLSSCYHSLLPPSHWLLTHHALEAFRQFAELTPHSSAVESCIPPDMTDVVISFLQKIPFQEIIYKERLFELLSPPIKIREEGSHSPQEQERPIPMPVAVDDLMLAWEKVESIGTISETALIQLTNLNKIISSYVENHSK